MPKTPKKVTPSDAAPTMPATQPYKLGARSCIACHQRKVRCDRAQPCVNCSKYGMTCVYPTKDTEETQKSPNLRDISCRLKRVEELLLRLAENNTTVPVTNHQNNSATEEQPGIKKRNYFTRFKAVNKDSTGSTWEMLLNKSDIEPLLQDATVGLKGTSSDTQAKSPSVHTYSPQGATSVSLSIDIEMLKLYPNPQLALQLWETYVKSVDPVVKILHIPTVQSTVIATILNPKTAQPSTVVLTFAIYYAAITTLFHFDDGSVQLPCEKIQLLKQYEKALDKLLLTSNVMSRPNMVDIQALAIYATCLRAHELGRRVWILTDLAIRLAQSIGLNRDGTSLKLPLFETEMRLRLWWHLCVLDSRVPEDQGFQTTIQLSNQELRLPLNVNDDQIYPDMTETPTTSASWTQMSFFLIQTESCRKILPVLDTQEYSTTNTLDEIGEKRKLLRDPSQHLSAKYGISVDSNSPGSLQDIATRHILTACMKMNFVLYLQEDIYLRKHGNKQKDESSENVKSPFQLACDTVQSSNLLLGNGFTHRFQWFFNMYTQWYALVYILRCLNSGTLAESQVKHVWDLLATCSSHIVPLQNNGTAETHEEHEHGRIWKLVTALLQQANSKRRESSLGPNSSNDAISHGDAGISGTSHQLPDTYAPGIPPIFPEWNDTGDESLSFYMPEIDFLPDWNAVINDI